MNYAATQTLIRQADCRRPASWRSRLTAWFCLCIARRRQRRALGALDERLLADVGLSRQQAAREARRPCWRP
jgi:uncharacterized protein YjiS (DUF1127 family)